MSAFNAAGPVPGVRPSDRPVPGTPAVAGLARTPRRLLSKAGGPRPPEIALSLDSHDTMTPSAARNRAPEGVPIRRLLPPVAWMRLRPSARPRSEAPRNEHGLSGCRPTPIVDGCDQTLNTRVRVIEMLTLIPHRSDRLSAAGGNTQAAGRRRRPGIGSLFQPRSGAAPAILRDPT
jgi:hypothetical protein